MKKLNITILLSVLLISFQSFQYTSIYKHRLLERTKTIKEESCMNIPKGYQKIISYDSVNDYASSLNILNKGGEEFIINILINGSTDGLTSFLHVITLYVIILVFAFVAFIIWPFMWCCWCCHCCIFNDNKSPGSIGTINLILSLGFSSLVLVSSIVALSQSNKYNQSFDGSVCFLSNFIDNASSGEEDTGIIPRWEGAKGISDSMKESMIDIKDIQEEYTGIDLPSTAVVNGKNAYQNKINALKSSYPIPDPSQSSLAVTVTPIYGRLLDDLYSSSSYIGQIDREKNNQIVAPIQAISDLDKLIKAITLASATFENDINAIESLLDDFQSLLDEINITVIDNIKLFGFIAIEMLLLSFKVVYALLIVICISSVVNLLLYILGKYFILRFVLHAIWNIIFILTILSYIIGSIIGIFSIISKQMIPTTKKVLSLEYMMNPESNFTSKESAKHLDTCLNKDGDLINSMNIESTSGGAKQFNDLIDRSIQINQIKSLIDSNIDSNSNTIPSIINEMEKYRLNINSTHDSYQTLLNAINKDLQTCGIIDRFYISGQTHENTWIEITGSETIPSITCDPSSTSQLMNDRLSNMHDSVKINHENINNILLSLNTMKPDYNALMILLKGDIIKADSYTSSLAETYYNRLESNSFFSLFNCGFIKYDLMSFMDLFGNKFSEASQTIAICCLLGSFASFIGVFFLMNTINYYTKSARMKELEDKGENIQLQTDKTNQIKTKAIKYSTIETI